MNDPVKDQYIRGVAAAEEQNRANIRGQFRDTLRDIVRIAAEAYDREQCWIRYDVRYRELERLAETCAMFGDTVEIPERLPPKPAGKMRTISPPSWAAPKPIALMDPNYRPFEKAHG